MNRITPSNKYLIISLLAFTFVLFSSQSLIGKNYYFSTSTGDDNRTSTQAQNPATPWKTITKLNSFFISLLPGDSVLFKRGETFYGTIIVGKSGSSSMPIILAAYGTGVKPVVTGFTNVTAWTNLGSNIWESSSAISTLSSCNIVEINGKNTAMGRYPNTGYLTYQSFSTNKSITSSSLTGTPNWTGAEAVIRKRNYIIDRNKITSQSGSTLNYTTSSTFSGQNGWGFFIQNDSRTLDKQNEWYYNPSTKKIRIYSTTKPLDVKVARVESVLTCNTKNYISLNNIIFKGANTSVITVVGSTNITIKNCDILYGGLDGINFWGSSYYNIENNLIKHCNDAGIFVATKNNYETIRYNIIDSTSMIPGICRTNAPAAIYMGAPNSLVQYNRIDHSGYNGIYSAGDYVQIRNNFINNSCLIRDDGGGIYPGGANVNVIVDGNIVLNTFGNTEGTNHTDPMSEGIYLDFNTTNTTVSNNTCANGRHYGIFASKSHNNIFKNNTTYNNGFVGLYISDWSGNTATYNNIVTNNILVAKEATQRPAEFRSALNDIPKFFSTLSGNYYARPIDDNETIRAGQPDQYSGGLEYKTLAEWQSFSGQDANSHKSLKTITNTGDLRFEYNATTAPVTISLPYNYIDVKNVSYNGSITLAPYTSAVLIKNGTATIQPTNQTPSILNQSFQINENSPNGTIVGTVFASDPDKDQALTYSILSGNTNGAFAIDASTGIIKAANSATLGSTSYSVFQSEIPSSSVNSIGDGTKPLELGMKFSSNIDGYISGLSYYKGIGAQGTHIGNLWSINGSKLASATFTGESASGWQTVTFTSPVAIKANTVYVVSYFSPHGDYVYSNNYFTTSKSNGPLTALASIDGQLNGVNKYTSTSAFPTSSYRDRNYWADVIFTSTLTPSSFALNVKVQDNGSPILSDQATVTININTLKSASTLSIISTPKDTVSVGSSYEYEVLGFSGNGSLINYTIENLPDWLLFTDNGNGTGIFKGIPNIKDVGIYQIILEGKDNIHLVQQVFTLEVKTNSLDKVPNQSDIKMNIYPNPVTNGILNIKFEEQVREQFELFIYEMSGKLLLKKQYDQVNSLSLDLSAFPPEVYLIQFHSRNFQFSKKIIIQ